MAILQELLNIEFILHRGDGTNSFPIDLNTNILAKKTFKAHSVAHACTWTKYFKIQIKKIPCVAFWKLAVSRYFLSYFL